MQVLSSIQHLATGHFLHVGILMSQRIGRLIIINCPTEVGKDFGQKSVDSIDVAVVLAKIWQI